MLQIKRIYETPAPEDGYRILVDRLWPRGMKKSTASLYAWMKEVAPSPSLRIWFAHDPERWDEFCIRYRHELGTSAAQAVGKIISLIHEQGMVTLCYAARDKQCNHARALQEYIKEQQKKKRDNKNKPYE